MKICEQCAQPFAPREGLSKSNYARQRFCSKRCSNTASARARRLDDADFLRWIESKGVENHATGCLEWSGGRHSFGYGIVGRDMRTDTVPRVAFALRHGPIPAGMDVCHSCDNPPCFADAHLFLGDAQANMADMVRKERHRRGEQKPGARLTAADVRAIRASTATARGAAEQFGVSYSTITSVRRREKWGHIQ